MQATITYCLTEAAQRAHMAASGQPVQRKQQHTIEVSAEDLPYLDAAEDGSLSRNLGILCIHYSNYPAPAQTTLDGAEAWRVYRAASAAKLAEIESAAAKKEADAIAFQDQNISDFLGGRDGHWYVSNGQHINNPWGRDVPLDHSQAPAILARIAAQEEDKKAKAIELKRRKEADEVAKVAREQAKTTYITEWIAANADPDTQAQFADGLLCRAAAVDMIANAVFAAAGVPDEIAEPVVCSSADCPCADNKVDYIPQRTYPAWRAIKAGLPKGSTAEFRKVRDCLRDVERGFAEHEREETATPAYYAAIITIPHGPFSFTRRVRLG